MAIPATPDAEEQTRLAELWEQVRLYLLLLSCSGHCNYCVVDRRFDARI